MSKYKVYTKEGSLIARIASRVLRSENMAVTIGRTIRLHNATHEDLLKNKAWLRHELKHVEQYRKHGKLRMLFMYLYESVRHGYHNNKYETEARNTERDAAIMEEYEVVKR